MMPLRTAMIRFPVSRVVNSASPQARMLSYQGESAVRKLKQVMEDYRVANYTQEVPSRFKKDIVQAAKDQNDAIAIDALQRVLKNIGAPNSLSPSELRTIFDELGEAGYIRADRMVQIL